MAEIKDYSTTAGNNNSASPNGMGEGMAPSGVNDSWREQTARIKRWYEDASAVNSLAGGTTAYTLAASRTISAYAAGDTFLAVCNATNTGASTLDVDSVGAKSIVDTAQVALTAGQLQANGIYLFSYDATNDTFICLNPSAYSLLSDTFFHVRLLAGINTTESTYEPIVWDDEVSDLGSNFGSNYYTVPSDGTYYFSASGQAKASIVDGGAVTLALYYDIGAGITLWKFGSSSRVGGAGTPISIVFHSQQLSAGDKIYVYWSWTASGGTNGVAGNATTTFFTGGRIG